MLTTQNLGNLATIYALSCGEKLSPIVHLWRKMTNMRSELASSTFVTGNNWFFK